jgi:hypothetical protein
MATVLLSRWTDTLCGFHMGTQSGAVAQRSVHPASPVLLTKNGPLRALRSYFFFFSLQKKKKKLKNKRPTIISENKVK